MRLIGLAVLAAACTAESAACAAGSRDARQLALLERLTWGASPSAAAAMERMGAGRWLEGQLAPAADEGLPPEIEAEIAALPVSQSSMAELVVNADAMGRYANQIADPEQRAAARKAHQEALAALGRAAAERSLLRDVYSQNQLQAQLTWFWMNHFNVHMQKRDIRAMVADYEDQAIRPHALGRFRDLLEATLEHPAMLRYLDNDQNAVGHINENYARELMELHTMGVGSGYTQKDVEELARILTGVGVDLSPNPPRLKPGYEALYVRAGLFEFNPNRHDFGDKLFLGHHIRGSGFGEVEQALDILARQPATARHVSLKLATYFMGDAPPQSVVDRMAGAFQRSDGDIAEVLRTLFGSREFAASLGGEFKDPTHYVISAVRLAYDGRVIRNVQPIQNWLNRLGEGFYNHETPDGYPLASAAWNGPGQMAVRFEIARQIGSGAPALFRDPGQPAAPPPPAPLPRLQAAVFEEPGGGKLLPATAAALAAAVSPQDWNTLYLASPDFMRR